MTAAIPRLAAARASATFYAAIAMAVYMLLSVLFLMKIPDECGLITLNSRLPP